MLRRSMVGVYLLFLATLPGCMATLARSDGAGEGRFRPLTATRGSLEMLSQTTTGFVTGRDEHGPIETDERFISYPLLGAFVAVDTPASVAADAFFLPADVIHEIKQLGSDDSHYDSD